MFGLGPFSGTGKLTITDRYQFNEGVFIKSPPFLKSPVSEPEVKPLTSVQHGFAGKNVSFGCLQNQKYTDILDDENFISIFVLLDSCGKQSLAQKICTFLLKEMTKNMIPLDNRAHVENSIDEVIDRFSQWSF